EWTLAALYRRGYALERFAQTIVETPVPPDIKRMGDEAVAAYQDILSQQTVKLEDKAVENYIATLAKAKEVHVSNEWTKKTLESLNRFRPKEYPVLKEPKSTLSTEGAYVDGVVLTPEVPYQEKPRPSAQVEPAPATQPAPAPAAAPADQAPSAQKIKEEEEPAPPPKHKFDDETQAAFRRGVDAADRGDLPAAERE